MGLWPTTKHDNAPRLSLREPIPRGGIREWQKLPTAVIARNGVVLSEAEGSNLPGDASSLRGIASLRSQ
jgi:hypothetical protein